MTDLRALAPVFLVIAISTIACKASSLKSNDTPSNKNNFLYCFTNEFCGSVKIENKASIKVN